MSTIRQHAATAYVSRCTECSTLNVVAPSLDEGVGATHRMQTCEHFHGLEKAPGEGNYWIVFDYPPYRGPLS